MLLVLRVRVLVVVGAWGFGCLAAKYLDGGGVGLLRSGCDPEAAAVVGGPGTPLHALDAGHQQACPRLVHRHALQRLR